MKQEEDFKKSIDLPIIVKDHEHINLQAALDKELIFSNSNIEQKLIHYDYVQTPMQAHMEKETATVAVQQVSDLLTQSLGGIDKILDLPKDFAIILTSSAITTLTSIITSSAIYFMEDGLRKSTKLVLATNIAVNATGFMSTVYLIFKQYDVLFNLPKAQEIIKDFADKMEKNCFSNSESLTAYTNYAITTVVTALVGGCYALDIDTKKLVNMGAVSRVSKEFITDITKVKDFLMEEVLQLVVSPEQAVIKNMTDLLEECNVVETTPLSDILVTPGMVQNMLDLQAKIITITSQKMSSECTKRTSTLRNLLTQSNTQIMTKVHAFNEYVRSTQRQEPVGLYLSGKPGIGKSALVSHIANEVSAALSISNGVYNLRADSGSQFFTPYYNESFGVVNEFASTFVQDPFIQRMNGIISCDPVNMEGASLTTKTQLCKLTCVILTSNELMPPLTNFLQVEATKAFWSRVHRIEVIDSAYEGRKGVNAHRREDFSHLVFKLYEDPDENVHALPNFKFITIRDLIHMIINLMRNKEVTFLKTLPRTPVVEQRLEKLTNRANAGKEYFVVRLQGPPGSGKTKMATQIANRMSNIFGAPIFEACFLNSPIDFGIYLIDDMLFADKYAIYLNWVNHGHPNNIYIIVTNLIYKRKTTLYDKVANMIGYDIPRPYYEVEVPQAIQGVTRRIGLEGLIYSNSVTDCNSETQVTFDFNRSYIIYNSEIAKTEEQVLQLIHERYISALKMANDIVVVRENYDGDMKFDVDMTATNNKELLNSLRTTTGLLQLFGARNPKVTLNCTEYVVKIMSQKAFVDSWIVPKEIGPEDIVQVMKRIAAVLRKYDRTLKFRLVSEDLIYIYADNVIYWPGKTFTNNVSLADVQGKYYMQVSQGNNIYIINEENFACWYVKGELRGNMGNIHSQFLHELKTYYDSHKINNTKLVKYVLAITNATEIPETLISRKRMLTLMKENKIITLAASILAVAGVASISVSLYKLVKKVITPGKTVTVYANTDRYGELDEVIQQYQKIVTEGNWFDQGDKFREGLGDKKQAFENWRRWVQSNSKTVAHSNTVNKEHNDKVITQLDIMTQILTRNLVRVDTKYGTNYGIVVKGKTFMTVSHIFDENCQEGTVEHDGKKYKFKLQVYHRYKDLAMCIIQDVQDFPDISKHLLPYPEFNEGKTVMGCYLRCIKNNPTLAFAATQFRKKLNIQITDITNPRYTLKDEVAIMDTTSIASVGQIIKIGDCGMPLLIKVENKWYVAGIHNGYNASNEVFFSTLTQLDVSCEAFSNSTRVEEKEQTSSSSFKNEHEEEYITHSIYKDVYSKMNCGKTAYEPSNSIAIGYSKILRSVTPKHKYIKVEGFKTPCLVAPSAINLDDVTDTSALYKSAKGPNTLFTQCEKFNRNKTYNINQKAMDITKKYLKQYYNENYGQFSAMNLNKILNGNRSHVKGLELSTSAGPLFKTLGAVNKKKIFEDVNPQQQCLIIAKNKMGEIFKNQYNDIDFSITNGKPYLVICQDNPKVETIPIAKVATGKVRLFNSMDVAVNAFLKKKFGELHENMVEKCGNMPCKIGQNPYTEATNIFRQHQSYSGDVLSFDISGYDKNQTINLIEDIYEIIGSMDTNYSEKQYKALVKTLTYRHHVVDGVIYIVNGGNPSGSYMTTIQNSIGIELITTYAIVCYLMEQNKLPNDINKIRQLFHLIVYGDDQVIKTVVPPEYFVKKYLDFGLVLTPGKSKGINFCSREFIFDDIQKLVYPQLKEESMSSMLYYVKELTAEHVDSLTTSFIMEALMYNEEQFNIYQEDLNLLRKKVSLTPVSYNYKSLRYSFAEYVRNNGYGSVLLETEKHDIHLNNSNTLNQKELTMPLNKSYTVKVYEIIAQHKLEKLPTIEYEGWNGWWTASVTYGETVYTTDLQNTKADAKEELCRKLYVDIAHYTKDDVIAADLLVVVVQQHMEKALKSSGKQKVYVLPKYLEYFTEDKNGRCVGERNEIYIREPVLEKYGFDALIGAYKSNFKEIVVDFLGAYIPIVTGGANTGTPVEPTSVAPDGKVIKLTPQMTSQTLAGEPPGELMVQTLQMGVVESANPIGPPDMTVAGGIQFNLLDQAYSNYVHLKHIKITTNQAPNTVLFSIGYGDEAWMSAHCKTWHKAHERFAGEFQYKFMVVGNTLYSGSIAIGWLPHKPSATLTFAELSQYPYEVFNLNMPMTKEFSLGDARMSNFYRLTSETSMDDRPHLVGIVVRETTAIATETPLVWTIDAWTKFGPGYNAYKPSITTAQRVDTIEGKQIQEVFPHFARKQLKIFTDGDNNTKNLIDHIDVEEMHNYTKTSDVSNVFSWELQHPDAVPTGGGGGGIITSTVISTNETEFVIKNYKDKLLNFIKNQGSEIQTYLEGPFIDDGILVVYKDPIVQIIQEKGKNDFTQKTCAYRYIFRTGSMMDIFVIDQVGEEKTGALRPFENMYKLPTTNIYTDVVFKQNNVEYWPTNYTTVNFATEVPVVITPQANLGTTSTNAVMLNFFKEINTPQRYIKFQLVNPQTLASVCDVIFDRETRRFALKSLDQIHYKILEQSVNKYIFKNVIYSDDLTVESTNTTSWLSRTATTGIFTKYKFFKIAKQVAERFYAKQSKDFKNAFAEPTVSINSNAAMIAGGIAQGLGQGISDYAKMNAEQNFGREITGMNNATRENMNALSSNNSLSGTLSGVYSNYLTGMSNQINQKALQQQSFQYNMVSRGLGAQSSKLLGIDADKYMPNQNFKPEEIKVPDIVQQRVNKNATKIQDFLTDKFVKTANSKDNNMVFKPIKHQPNDIALQKMRNEIRFIKNNPLSWKTTSF